MRTFEPVTMKPEPKLALDEPLNPIAGWQPSELILAVQYATGELHGQLRRNTSAEKLVSLGTRFEPLLRLRSSSVKTPRLGRQSPHSGQGESRRG